MKLWEILLLGLKDESDYIWKFATA